MDDGKPFDLRLKEHSWLKMGIGLVFESEIRLLFTKKRTCRKDTGILMFRLLI